MSHSVKITTPIPSPEEIASDMGITRSRLDNLLALVDGETKSGAYNRFRHASAVKKAAAKKAPAKRTTGKRGRTAR